MRDKVKFLETNYFIPVIQNVFDETRAFGNANKKNENPIFRIHVTAIGNLKKK
jgi:hypothetical protein